jgi:hypothetical protein
MAYLSDTQKESIERLARSKGQQCQLCGNPVLGCADEQPRQQIGNVTVRLRCDNREAHPEGASQPFRFPFDEAREIGVMS